MANRHMRPSRSCAVPILHPDDRDLAAESLLAAGEQLEKAGDPAERGPCIGN